MATSRSRFHVSRTRNCTLRFLFQYRTHLWRRSRVIQEKSKNDLKEDHDLFKQQWKLAILLPPFSPCFRPQFEPSRTVGDDRLKTWYYRLPKKFPGVGVLLLFRKNIQKVAGRADLEDGVRKLDKLTNEEVAMASVQLVKVTHNIDNNVSGIDDGVRGVDVKV
ncbi:hypothetical protein EDB84DRAFT_1675880 [Lactarius hengduanensis]|nr:hypothetical protein EDB84DRAFT_1675880 [Lactarius hengduanensis]